MNKIYLDYNAASPLRDTVKQAYIHALDTYGNPSSIYQIGRDARKACEDVREKIASYCGVAARNIIFTSGATESNHLAIRGNNCDAILVPYDEHDCVLSACKMSGKSVFYLKLTADGYIDDASFHAAITSCKDNNLRPLLTMMKVNNETGRIKDLSTYSQIIRQMNGIVHSDAVQAFGKIPFEDWTYQTDMITLSAHKVGGAKGVGILMIKDNIPITPLMSGGGQEMGHRAGTQNVPAIMALGAFMDCVAESITHTKNCKIWRDKIIKTIKHHNPDAVIICDDEHVIHNTVYVITPQISAQNQVIRADLSGLYISSGSACSSGKVKSSHVIISYGYNDHLSASGIRISMGFKTTDTDIEQFCNFYTGLKF